MKRINFIKSGFLCLTLYAYSNALDDGEKFIDHQRQNLVSVINKLAMTIFLY